MTDKQLTIEIKASLFDGTPLSEACNECFVFPARDEDRQKTVEICTKCIERQNAIGERTVMDNKY